MQQSLDLGEVLEPCCGVGEPRVADEVDALGCERVMLIGTGSPAAAADEADVAATLGWRLVAHWTEVVQHVPAELAERAREMAVETDIDCIVTIGGGSSTGLAKAIALTMRSRRKDSKFQDPSQQVRVKRADRVRLISMPSEKQG